MNSIDKTRQLLRSGFLPILICVPVVLFFSIMHNMQKDNQCQIDVVVPYCTQGSIQFIGNESLHGGFIDLSRVEPSECQGDRTVYYFLLEDGSQMDGSTFLPFGTYWIQSLVSDADGGVSTCSFAVEVICPSIGWPIVDQPEILTNDVGEIPLMDLPEEDLQILLGTLSVRWESGERGPGAISTGIGDPGGRSYGLYQISLNKGYLQDFLNFEGQPFRPVLSKYPIGSASFDKAWRSIAETHPVLFHKAQHEYIRRSHYKRAAMRIQRQLGLNINDYSLALKDVLWSTAVQHGPYNDVFFHALKDKRWENMSEAQIIRAVYRERSRTADGQLAYFPRVGPQWQKNLTRRFRIEERMALSKTSDHTGESIDHVLPDSLLRETVDSSSMATFASSSEDAVPRVSAQKPRKNRKKVKPEVFAQINTAPVSGTTEKKTSQAVAQLVSAKETGSATEISSNLTSKSQSSGTVTSEPIPKKNETVYRVLFVVLKDSNASFPKLNGIGKIHRDPIVNGQYRYLVGDVKNKEDARDLLETVKNKGYRAAVIARYTGSKLSGFVN